MRGLNPKLLDFETVAMTAETVELASGVTERRNMAPKAENYGRRAGSWSVLTFRTAIRPSGVHIM